jgi:hypothetical protein
MKNEIQKELSTIIQAVASNTKIESIFQQPAGNDNKLLRCAYDARH